MALLELEDLVEHAVDSASLEPVVGYEVGFAEQQPEPARERTVNPRLTVLERPLEDGKAGVQHVQLGAPRLVRHGASR
jgi:hypothetical protein